MGGDAPIAPVGADWRRLFDPRDWFLEPCAEAGSLFGLALESPEPLHDERSAFQHIQVFQSRHYGRVLVLDRILMITGRDNFIYHEMLTHPVLYTHPHPRRVLVIGGGDCGCLREVLRHETVESCVQVELDERVTRVAERWFPELCEANGDPRATLRFEDGISFIEQAGDASFDVIIVDSTDPIGQAARLFSRGFYHECRRVLGEAGVLAVQSESPLIHTDVLAGIHREMRAAGFPQVSALQFPQSSYPSGWWSATLAGGAKAHKAPRAAAPGRNRPVTRYYNSAVHRGAMELPEFLARRLAAD